MMPTSTKKGNSTIPRYTRGWFCLGWSDDIKIGQIKKLHQFGQLYTLFRGEDGIVGLIDDICPHLGAHFSDGGVIKGNSVRCPYHHWCFDRRGQCTSIPYSNKIPAKAQVKSYPLVEQYGMIFMYRDQAGSTPPYAVPQIENFAESQYMKPAKFEFAIRIHGQDIMENSVDSAHFRAVHGHSTTKNDFHVEGKELRITQVIVNRRFALNFKGHLEFHMIEPGFHYVRFPEVMGTNALVFSSIVPIDEEMTNHRLSIWIHRSRIPGYARLVRSIVVHEMMRTYHEDMQIWESKEFLPHPVLCDGDGAIIKLRKWYSQFFEAQPTSSTHSLA